MKFKFIVVIFFLIFSSITFSQSRKSPFRLALVAEQTDFNIGESAKVKLNIENNTGKAIPRVDYLSFYIRLERPSLTERGCSWNDCYMAVFSPIGKVELPNNGVFETEIDLTGLHWVDTIDSNSSLFGKDKNFFTEIMSGDFHLKAEVVHVLNLWKKNDRRFKKTIESNKILTTIKTEKEFRKHL